MTSSISTREGAQGCQLASAYLRGRKRAATRSDPQRSFSHDFTASYHLRRDFMAHISLFLIEVIHVTTLTIQLQQQQQLQLQYLMILQLLQMN